MGKKRRRTSNQRDDTWTKGPGKPADAAPSQMRSSASRIITGSSSASMTTNGGA